MLLLFTGSLLTILACRGTDPDHETADTGTSGAGEDAVLYLRSGDYPTADPSDIALTGGVRDPIDIASGQVADDWAPSFSAVVQETPVALPHVGLDNLEECWSYVFISEAEDLSDRLGSSLPLTIGTHKIAMDDIGGGVYIGTTDGAVADSIKQQGGDLSFGGTSPGIGLPEPFDLHDRSATLAGMADEGVLTLSWTPGAGGVGSYILVGGLGNENADLEDEENFVCALQDDGSAVIDLQRPRPDVSLGVSRAHSAWFESAYGDVLAVLIHGDVFIRP